jgi:putative oxidoreductase
MERSLNPAVGNTAPYAAFLLRLALGIMFLAHGLTKLLVFTPAGTAKFFASVGFPGFLAYPVIAFEVIGGAMLILGVLPRWVAGLAAAELLVASTVHWGNGWAFAAPNGGGWEYPVFLAVTAAALALLGDGAWALKPSLRK